MPRIENREPFDHMLIRLDADLLPRQTYDDLLGFLRHPFTPQSCRYVERSLPQLGPAYRAVADGCPRWESTEFASLLDRIERAFTPLLVRARSAPPPVVVEQLLRSQVALLEGELRDHLDRKRRDDSGRSPAPADPDATALALRALSMHEATFFALVGLFDVRVERRRVDFGLTELGEESLWNRVRSTTIELFSEGATDQHFDRLLADLRTRLRGESSATSVARRLSAKDLDLIAVRLLDTCFSLSQRMQADPVVKPLIEDARQLCRWMALLMMVRKSGEHVFAPDTELMDRLALDASLPERVIRSRANELRSDQGIYRTTRGEYTLGTWLSLSHALSSCKKVVLTEAATARLGKHFETHIKSYVAEGVPPGDYIVREGLQADGRHAGRSFDCDLVLFEPRRRKVFFVQAKWKRESRTANLEDEMKLWRAENFALRKGVDQMRGLRDRLSEPEILDRARTRLQGLGLSDQEIVQNASYVVVHTLPFFSAYLSEGVAVYEWNLFRNVLLRGTVQRHVARGPLQGLVVAEQRAELLDIEDPDAVVNHFVEAMGADPAEFSRMRELRTRARYGFEIEMPPRTRWQRMLGPKRLLISRPYV